MQFQRKIKENTEEWPDKDLVSAILEESNREKIRVLQEELYYRYAEKIFGRCVTLVRNREVAKDLAHDILVKIFTNLNKYRAEAPFYSWVFSITYNHCMTYLEKQKKLKLEDFETHSFDIASDEDELQIKILKDLQLSQLELLLEKLSEAERMILLMRYKEGMSVKEIAKVLNLGESAIKMRLKRSRDQLANLFKDLTNDYER